MVRNRASVSRRYSSVYGLVASSNSGRFALGEADGCDLTCGQAVSLFLGGRWIDGCVEYYADLYPLERTFGQAMREASLCCLDGYCFVAPDGNICGLCVGMRVRLIMECSQ